MKTMRNILIYCIAIVSALSCVKDGKISDVTSDAITFAPEVPETKAFINGTFPSGSSIVVCDYMTKLDGTDGWYYIDQASIANPTTGKVWDYTSPTNPDYVWIYNTSHNFFGWLTSDGTTTPNDVTWDASSRILSVPAKKFAANTTQYDFLYSDVVKRTFTRENPDNATVDLQMNHLFSAFRLHIENYRNQTIEIKSVQLRNLYTTKSAQIDFNNSAAVTFSDKALETVTGTTQNLAKNGKYNPLNTTTDAYFMIWPQSGVEFDQALLSISYRFENKNYTKEWKLEEIQSDVTEWLPGKRYNYTIKFTDKEVELICNVVEWEKDEQLLDFADHVSVRAEGEIDWDETTLKAYNYETGEIVVKSNGAAANCTFTIDTPEGAVWTASLITIAGPSDAFSFVGDNFGPVGTQANLSIKANYTGTGQYQTTHKAYLQITVQTLDNRTIVVKDLIPDGKSYWSTGYTIIQDMI